MKIQPYCGFLYVQFYIISTCILISTSFSSPVALYASLAYGRRLPLFIMA